jgi:hypothetical protein
LYEEVSRRPARGARNPDVQEDAIMASTTRTLSPAQALKAAREAAVANAAGDPTPSPVVPDPKSKALSDDQRYIVTQRHPRSGLPTKFEAIAKAINIQTGKAHLLYMQAQYPSDIQIPCTPVNVWRMRLAEGKSWGEMAAICGVAEGKVRKTYGAGPVADKGVGCNVGRGGRKPNGFDPKLANTATAKAIRAAKAK